MTESAAASSDDLRFPAASPFTRRDFLRAVTVSAGMVLAGCSRPSSQGKITLTQWYHQYGEKGTHEAVLRYAQQYTRRNPHIEIQVIWVPGDYQTKLNTALLTGGGPDIFEGAVTQAMVDAGQIAPLDDLFPPKVRSAFNPLDIAENTVYGKIYGVKTVVDVGLLYYRPSLLQAAGLAVPSTMDALIAAAQKLTTTDRKGLFVGNDGGIGALFNIAPWSAGSQFLVSNQIVFNNERTVLAYEKVRQMNDSGALLIGAPTDWYDPSAFTQGLTAMQWSGLWAYPAIKQALGSDVGAIPWPALDSRGKPATFLGGWTEMVNGQSRQIAEAKRFIQWLWIENTADQRDWCLSYGFHVPPQLRVAQDAEALKAPVPAAAVQALNLYGQYLPPGWNAAMNTALINAMTNIIKFNQNAASQVREAATTCEKES